MTPVVKICCITSVAEAELAIAAGAAVLGLVSAMPSGPGVIADELIAEIAARVPPPIETFLLTARQTASAIAEQQRRCGTTAVQLVDHVPSEELARLRTELPRVKLVQVIHVRDERSVDEAREVAAWVDAVLLDSGNPALAVKELGGTGRTHDWSLSRRIRESVARPVFLAGGLRAENVAAAVRAVAPFGLDVCSGVRSGGELDPVRLRALFDALASSH